VTGVRDLSRDNSVHMSCIVALKLLLQKDEQMDVRQTILLTLYGEDKAKDILKQAILYVFEHGLDL